MLCIDETKLNSSFLDHQFKIEEYLLQPLTRDGFCSRGFYYEANKRKTLKLYVLNLPLFRKGGVFFLLTGPQTLKKKNFFIKFQLVLIKYQVNS